MSDAQATKLLAAARTVLDHRAALAVGSSWPRAIAFLGRQSLESAVGGFWAAEAAGMRSCSFRMQLLCLPWYLPEPRDGRAIHQLWAALSSACHHHAYDLAPTAAELRRWLTDVELALGVLATGTRGIARGHADGR